MKKIFIVMGILAAFTAAAYAYQSNVDYWVVDGNLGVAVPALDTASNLNIGFDAGISARKGLDPDISVGGGLSFVNMSYKFPGAPAPFSATVFDLEAVYAPYVPDFIVWPYAKFGLGLYMLNYDSESGTGSAATSSSQSATSFGFMFGGGLRYPITNDFAADVEALFNQCSVAGGTGDVYDFVTFRVGLTMYLK
jgi:opacity protein-like surface antigen